MEKILFGERLRNAREASGMSQKTMANRIGVKSVTVEKWESGKLDPRANRLQMLASLLNVPLLWLMAGSQQVPDPTAGITREKMLLQKIADLDSIINLLKSDLDELRVLAESGD
jgi:transcriptional regulator with XRE-family HTH domain